MLGIIMSIVAGGAMGIQGVFNTRLGEKTGIYEANVIVSFLAFCTAVMVMIFFGKGNISAASNINKLYLTGGFIGTVITVTVMLAIGNLSPVYATGIILISQLAVSAIIDSFGLFGAEQINFTWTKVAGLVFMIGGIILFKV